MPRVSPTPPPPPPPPPVEETSKEISDQTKQAKRQQETQAKKAFGRQSTVLTGALGETEQAKTAQKTLLGS